LKIFRETVPFYTRDFFYLWGKLLYGQDRNLSQISFCGSAKRLRIVCGVSVRKSVNSAGLERGFFRQKQAFYKCDPK
jgi:hypothetical protein